MPIDAHLSHLDTAGDRFDTASALPSSLVLVAITNLVQKKNLALFL
jgi:hypothetical protein